MCHHHTHRHRAASLDDGAAHDRDHHDWTRRDFILRAGLGTATAVTLGSTRAYALDGGSLLRRLAALDTNRVLVLIQLQGGNDGLNTIVPVRDDRYYNARPSIAIAPGDTVSLNDDLGFHPALAPLEGLWGDGRLGIVHGVGYDDSSLSHFAATDIWSTARTNPERDDGGWVGGTLRTSFPTFEESIPEHPPAVQLGANNPLLFQSGESDLSMRIANARQLDQIVAGDGFYDPDDVPGTSWGSELGFIRAIANASNVYAASVQQAGSEGTNAVEYPDNSNLADSLAAVARLIKGGLSSRVYLVSLSGFDTHANQIERQNRLLGQLGGSLAAFQDDLVASGDDGRVLTMTFSEFGRRVSENGSSGTDHGTAAPLFAMGTSVDGGFFGPAPNLSDLDDSGNIRHSTDFRSVYAAALGSWLGLDTPDLDAILGGSYDPVGFVARGVATAPPVSGDGVVLGSPAPNPVRGQSQIPFTLGAASRVSLAIFDVRGRLVTRLTDRAFPAGAHVVPFDAGGLPAGVYVIRLDAAGQSRTTQATVIR